MRKIRRRGFTLLEILLVIAVMVLVAATAIPALQRSFTIQSIKSGAERVRGEMGRARVLAMKEDQVYAFYYTPGSSHFVVAPYTGARPADDAGPLDDRQRISHMDMTKNLLPQRVRFAEGNVIEDSRSQYLAENSSASIANMTPILFYPDGSAQDASVLLMNDKGDYAEVSVRGLTGTTNLRLIDDPAELR